MPAIRASRPQVSSGDRLSFTLVIVLILHAVVILGIGFGAEDRKKPPQKLPGLEVTLVQSKSDKKNTDADFLAQATQEGGGNTEERVRLASPVAPVVPTNQAGEVREFVPETQMPSTPQPQQKDLLTATMSSTEVQAGQELPEQKQQVTAAQIMTLSQEIARLSAEIDQNQKVFARQPRKKFIASNTKEYRFASYEEGWRAKVERIGTLNFPDEARRNQLSGSLLLAITIRADGTVKSIDIRKPSGHKILDDAAVRIVRLAAPFAPFPADIRKDYDELVIVRTWKFDAGSHFSTSR